MEEKMNDIGVIEMKANMDLMKTSQNLRLQFQGLIVQDSLKLLNLKNK